MSRRRSSQMGRRMEQMLHRGGALLLVTTTLGMTAIPAGAANGVADTDHPAAILVYPYIVANTSAGQDTFIEVTNTASDRNTPVSVLCYYLSGDAELPTAIRFRFRLTARQPVAWRASTGLSVFPLADRPDGNGDSFVPPVPNGAFVGSLRCIAIDANEVPVERNVLLGSARIEQFDASTQSLRLANYRAMGLQAIVGAGNGDNTLIIGGPSPEYDGCPQTLTLNHFADGATLRTAGRARDVTTIIALVSCSANFRDSIYPSSALLLEQHSELAEVTGTGQIMGAQLVRHLSELGGSGTRSIFHASVQGTATGQTIIATATGSAPLGVAIEFHGFADDGHVATNAITLQSHGRSEYEDRIELAQPAEPTPPPATEVPTGTPPPTSTRTAPVASPTPTPTFIRPPPHPTPSFPRTPTLTPALPAPTGNDGDSCAIAPQPSSTTAMWLMGGVLGLLAAKRRKRAN